jgi:MinD superfamily P-loop ATPase
MKIAVLSGKGGTGKTTFSSNLAVNVENVKLIDTDVEEPNAHIFLGNKAIESKSVMTLYPVVDADKCTLCGKCGEFCNYNAIIPAKNTVLVFKETCHDCGGCEVVCPVNAIKYEQREIGKIHNIENDYNIKFEYGELNIGEMSGVKIIEKLKSDSENEELLIIDSPPGTSCATVAAVEDTDYAIIVSEPTPFGVSDMKMVVEMLREMKIPFSVVINKAGIGNDEIYEYCKTEEIEILMEIPFDKKIAEYYAKGDLFSKKIDGYVEKLQNVLKKVKEGCNNG